jgi:hypothetical protein
VSGTSAPGIARLVLRRLDRLRPRADSCVVPVPPDIDSAVATACLDRKYP